MLPSGLPPVLDGSLLATCEELGLLGEGAYGVVHRVLVTPPGGGPAFEAARKQTFVDAPNALPAFTAEMEVLQVGLGCPYIVQILDARTTEEHHEILLELLRGGNLAEAALLHTRTCQFSEGRVKAIALDVLRGLAHLHAHRICCRDVKAQNIMLRDKGGQAVLVDFGTACKADKTGRLDCQATFVGTISTMAPEMYGTLKPRSAGAPGKATRKRQPKQVPIFLNTDVYSLGVTLVGCSVCGGGRKELGEVSSAPLREFLRGLLAEHPDQRLSADEALQHPYLAGAQGADHGWQQVARSLGMHAVRWQVTIGRDVIHEVRCVAWRDHQQYVFPWYR